MTLVEYGIILVAGIGITFVLGEYLGAEQRPMNVQIVQKAFDMGKNSYGVNSNGDSVFLSSQDEYILLVLNSMGDEDLLDTDRKTYLSVKADENYTLLCTYGGLTGERGKCVL